MNNFLIKDINVSFLNNYGLRKLSYMIPRYNNLSSFEADEDLSNCQAYGSYSSAIGIYCTSGAKTFKLDIEKCLSEEAISNHRYYFTDIITNEQSMEIVNSQYSIILSANFDYQGKIISVGANYVQVDNYITPTSSDYFIDNLNFRNTKITANSYFLIPQFPDYGTNTIGSGAISLGYANKALGAASFSCGYNNQSAGKYSFTAGQNNKAGYCSAVFGNESYAYGINSFMVGTRTRSTEPYTYGIGYNNTFLSGSMYGNCLGTGLIVTDSAQTVLGKYNSEESSRGCLLVVGNGEGTGGRGSNTLTLSPYGELSISGGFTANGNTSINGTLNTTSGVSIGGSITANGDSKIMGGQLEVAKAIFCGDNTTGNPKRKVHTLPNPNEFADKRNQARICSISANMENGEVTSYRPSWQLLASSGNKTNEASNTTLLKSTMPLRDGNGNIAVAWTPVEIYHATSKKYVDSEITKLSNKVATSSTLGMVKGPTPSILQVSRDFNLNTEYMSGTYNLVYNTTYFVELYQDYYTPLDKPSVNVELIIQDSNGSYVTQTVNISAGNGSFTPICNGTLYSYTFRESHTTFDGQGLVFSITESLNTLPDVVRINNDGSMYVNGVSKDSLGRVISDTYLSKSTDTYGDYVTDGNVTTSISNLPEGLYQVKVAFPGTVVMSGLLYIDKTSNEHKQLMLYHSCMQYMVEIFYDSSANLHKWRTYELCISGETLLYTLTKPTTFSLTRIF